MTTILWWLAQNTITAGVLILLATVGCRLLRHRPAMQHALWMVVLLKFLTPPLVVWPWSVDELAGALLPPAVEVSQDQAPAPRAPDPPRPAPAAPGTEWPAGWLPPEVAQQPRHEPAEPPAPAPAAPGMMAELPWAEVLAAVWLLGAGVVAGLQWRRVLRCRRWTRHTAAAPEGLLTEARTLAAALGVRSPPVLVVRGIPAPFVWCLGWLRLLWPERLADAIPRYRGVLAHELAHVKRRDHWVAWLELAAGVLWWWCPLFWYVRGRLHETAEMACDAWALQLLPADERRLYAEAFLELSQAATRGAPAAALGVNRGARRTFQRRFFMILSDRVSAKTSWPGLLAAALLGLLALPTWSPGQFLPPATEGQAAPPEKKPNRFLAVIEILEPVAPRPAAQAQQDDKTPVRYTAALALVVRDQEARAAKQLQGSWLVEAITANGKPQSPGFDVYRWTFTDRTIQTFWVRKTNKGGEAAKNPPNRFQVQPGRDPKELTIYGDNLLLQAIYRLEGDRLIVAFHGRAEAGRPTSFTPAKAKDNLGPLMVFQFRREAAGLQGAENPSPAKKAQPGDLKAQQLYHEQIRKAYDEWIKKAANKPGPRPGADKNLQADEEFIRRAFLDATGVLPRPGEVKDFLKDPDPNKRAKLVDQLLEGAAEKKGTKELRQKMMDAWKSYMDLQAADVAPKAQGTYPPDLPEEIRFHLKGGKLYMTVKTRKGSTTVPVPVDQPPAQKSKPDGDGYFLDKLKVYPDQSNNVKKDLFESLTPYPPAKKDVKGLPTNPDGLKDLKILPNQLDESSDLKIVPIQPDRPKKPGTEEPKNTQRLPVTEVDPKGTRTVVYTLKHTSLEEVVPKLRAVLIPKDGNPDLVIVPGPNTNSILLRGNRELLNRAQEVLRKLDTPAR